MFSRLVFSSLFVFAVFSCTDKTETHATTVTSADSVATTTSTNSVLMGGKPVQTYAQLPGINQ